MTLRTECWLAAVAAALAAPARADLDADFANQLAKVACGHLI